MIFDMLECNDVYGKMVLARDGVSCAKFAPIYREDGMASIGCWNYMDAWGQTSTFPISPFRFCFCFQKYCEQFCKLFIICPYVFDLHHASLLWRVVISGLGNQLC